MPVKSQKRVRCRLSCFTHHATMAITSAAQSELNAWLAEVSKESGVDLSAHAETLAAQGTPLSHSPPRPSFSVKTPIATSPIAHVWLWRGWACNGGGVWRRANGARSRSAHAHSSHHTTHARTGAHGHTPTRLPHFASGDHCCLSGEHSWLREASLPVGAFGHRQGAHTGEIMHPRAIEQLTLLSSFSAILLPLPPPPRSCSIAHLRATRGTSATRGTHRLNQVGHVRCLGRRVGRREDPTRCHPPPILTTAPPLHELSPPISAPRRTRKVLETCPQQQVITARHCCTLSPDCHLAAVQPIASSSASRRRRSTSRPRRPTLRIMWTARASRATPLWRSRRPPGLNWSASRCPPPPPPTHPWPCSPPDRVAFAQRSFLFSLAPKPLHLNTPTYTRKRSLIHSRDTDGDAWVDCVLFCSRISRRARQTCRRRTRSTCSRSSCCSRSRRRLARSKPRCHTPRPRLLSSWPILSPQSARSKMLSSSRRMPS